MLVADDDSNDHVLMLLAAESSTANVKFRFVSDGDQLLDALTNPKVGDCEPNLIVLDLRMPGLGGHGTLQRLQEVSDGRGLPVVIFTTSTSDADREAALAAGAASVQIKPTRFAGMVEFVDSLPTHAKIEADVPARAHTELASPSLVDTLPGPDGWPQSR